MADTVTALRPAFLLSLPRSGSTLLQRLLGAHSQIATVAEPWLLLAPLYALRNSGVYAEYGHRTTSQAIDSLCDRLPRGRADYLDSVAAMAQSVYERLSPSGTAIFLDKTPRYGLVIEELIAAFPGSPLILLHRNPLAVLASISSTFDDGRWKPYHHKQDLYLLAERLLAAQQAHPERFTTVRYEDVIAEPEPTLRRIVAALDLPWEDGILETFTTVSVEGRVGDSTGTYAYDRLSTEPLAKWRQHLATPIRKAWVRHYLRWLGSDRLESMGYSMEALLRDVREAPTHYAHLAADAFDAARGALWSLIEVESVREKIRKLPRWREIFTHT